MDRIIHKWELPSGSYKQAIAISMVIRAELLHVECQRDVLCLWEMHDPAEQRRETRVFHIFGTGTTFEQPDSAYFDPVGTALDSAGMVWHVLEVIPVV